MNSTSEGFRILAEQICQDHNVTIIEKEKMLQKKIDCYNSQKGTLPDINGKPCPKCNNKGFIAIDKNGEFAMKKCECNSLRRILKNIEKSGLSDVIRDYTFKNYKSEEAWQQKVKQKALDFLKQDDNKWFYIGGQVGSGKSFICTAICGEYIKRGKECKYMLWREESTRLKSLINDFEEYDKRINEIKNIDILYIDDFLKVKQGELPTPADINLAFDILNYRYNTKSKITIISSEYLLSTIFQIDEAVASRIAERCGQYEIAINYDERKNMRMKL